MKRKKIKRRSYQHMSRCCHLVRYCTSWKEIPSQKGLYRVKYSKTAKTLGTWQIAVIVLKLEHGFTSELYVPKDADGMANSIDQDQDQDSLLVTRRNDNHSPGQGSDCVIFVHSRTCLWENLDYSILNHIERGISSVMHSTVGFICAREMSGKF